ncbi:MAG: SDR family NAD(P)-dependent oxidoreductase [Chloroflexota bacterium]
MSDAGMVVITGASGGIGAATARMLAGLGHPVALADMAVDAAETVAASIRAAGGEAWAGKLDVTDPDSVEALLDAAEAALGPVCHAVTSAGIIKKAGFLELDAAAWRRTLDINLTGTWLVFQRVARRMVAGGRGGSLVALSSVAGRSGRANAADYAASKSAVISVVKSAALALAPHGIRANAVCPGVVDTPMTTGIHEQNARELGITQEESLRRMVAGIPLGRLETADEVAEAICFLLGDHGRYVTGQALNVCGGIEMD